MAGCRKCGQGGGKKDLQVLSQQAGPAANGNSANNGWVLFEYIGTPIQIRQVQSHKNRARKYRYGGQPGETQRRVLVHPDDAELFLARPQDFKLADIKKELEAAAPLRVSKAEPPVLKADRGFLPEPELSIDLLQNYGLRIEVISVLKSAQYSTIERLRFASDADLLSIKGISDKRLTRIKESLRAFLQSAAA